MQKMIHKDFWMKVLLVACVLGMAVSYKKIFFFHLTAVFIGIVLFVPYFRKKSEFHFLKQPTRLHWFPMAMFLWYLVMTLFSQHVYHSLKYVFYVANGAAIVYLLVYYTETLALQKKVFLTLAGIFSLEIAVSLLEIYTSFRMPLSPYSSVLSYFGRQYITYEDRHVLEYLPTGFHWNPNDLTVAVLLTLPFFLLAKKIIVKFVGSISVLLIILAADSRGCFIIFFLLLVLYIIMYQRNLIKIILPVFILSLAIIPFYIEDIKESTVYKKGVYSTESLKAYITREEGNLDSIGLRQRLMGDGLQWIHQSRGVGIGPGENMYIHKQSIRQDYYAMHNYWLELCVDGGVVFGLFFMFWYWYMAYKLQRVGREAQVKEPQLAYYARATFLSFVGFYFSVISLSSASYFLPMWLMFGFAIITIHNGIRIEKKVNI